jgi:hypothetical protein
MTALNEYLPAVRRMSLDDARKLMRHGVALRSITTVCPAPTRVALDGNDLYRPDPLVQSAWVMPVCAVDPRRSDAIETVDPLGIVSLGPVIDLVAFHPAAPNRWALRLGLATVLGAIEPQCCSPDPVPVRRDITAWLRGECRGIVLLTRDATEARRVLSQIETIEAEDRQHVDELAALLAAPLQMRSRVIARTPPRAAA